MTRLTSTESAQQRAKALHRSWTGDIDPLDLIRHSKDQEPAVCTINICSYSPDKYEMARGLTDLSSLAKAPKWAQVRWIDVQGINPTVINRLQSVFKLNEAAVEEVYQVPQRPKVDVFQSPDGSTQVFVVVHLLTMTYEGRIDARQIAMFLVGKTVITIHDKTGYTWSDVETRVVRGGSRLRQNNSSFLVFSLLDTIAHNCFKMLEHYGDHLEILEDDVLSRTRRNGGVQLQRRIHTLKREILMVRRLMWSLREVMHSLSNLELQMESTTARGYTRDVYDHIIQALDIIETYRELSTSLSELYMSSISNQMNEVMTMLTLVSSIFIPLTFICGVYGMNFESMPELNWSYGYLMFWVVCITMVFGMINYYKFKGWV